MSSSTNQQPIPDQRFLNLQLYSFAMAATFIAYVAAAQFLANECCGVSRIAQAVALGLPSALSGYLISRSHVFSAAQVKRGARDGICFVTRVLVIFAFGCFVIATTDILAALHRGAAVYFSWAIAGFVLLLVAHSLYMRLSQLSSQAANGKEDADS